jgi:hypothetical protein
LRLIMKIEIRKSEQGQAAVLLAIAMIVLLGFTALAVDGSMVYSDRRFSQDGADAASLAGGLSASSAMDSLGINYANWPCPASPNTSDVYTDAIPASLSYAETAAVSAAIQRASNNSFAIDNDTTDNHGVKVYCGQEMVDGRLDKFMDVKVMITNQTKTAFAHFVFKGAMVNTVEAITRIRPRHPYVYGNAIVALNPAGCSGNQNGVKAHGTAGTLVTGGGVFSNGCLRGVGNVQVNVVGGPGVNYVVENQAQAGVYNPDPTQADSLPDSSFLMDEEPNCGDTDAHNLTAANFETLLKSASGLNPGLYCVTGNVRINGGAEVHLTAPPEDPDPSPAVSGMLIYAPASNQTEWTINGNESSNFTGTILVPGATVNFLGTGGTDGYHTQLIAYNVEMGGTASLNVVYQDNEQAHLPVSMELHR